MTRFTRWLGQPVPLPRYFAVIVFVGAALSAAHWTLNALDGIVR